MVEILEGNMTSKNKCASCLIAAICLLTRDDFAHRRLYHCDRCKRYYVGIQHQQGNHPALLEHSISHCPPCREGDELLTFESAHGLNNYICNNCVIEQRRSETHARLYEVPNLPLLCK